MRGRVIRRCGVAVALLGMSVWGCNSETTEQPSNDVLQTDVHDEPDVPVLDVPVSDAPETTPDVPEDPGTVEDPGVSNDQGAPDDGGETPPTEQMLGNGLQTCESVLLKPDEGEEGALAAARLTPPGYPFRVTRVRYPLGHGPAGEVTCDATLAHTLRLFASAETPPPDVPALVAKYANRLPILHLKDGPLVQGEPHTAVGGGKMDIPALVNAADPNVLRWLVVELDDCATDMMQAVRDSYEYLTSHGLAEGNR